MKHAHPEDREGKIDITLHEDGDRVEIVVSDDGVGIPPDLDIETTRSLGLHLVWMLTKQLNGTLELDRTNGTSYKITF